MEGGSAPPGYYRAIPPAPRQASPVAATPPSAGAKNFRLSAPATPPPFCRMRGLGLETIIRLFFIPVLYSLVNEKTKEQNDEN